MAESRTGNQTEVRVIPVLEDQSRALMQAVPDLVFLLGLDGRYIDIFSAAAEDLFVPREQLIGRKVFDVLPSPVGEDCMAAIHRLTSPSDVSSFSYELTIEGRPRWFEGRVTFCGTDTVIVLVRDFTEQRRAENDLRDANRALRLRAQQLQRLEQELTRVEQRERRRMAHKLHDSLQQLLVGAKLGVAVLAERATGDEQCETATEVIKVLDEAIHQTRMLTADLCPPILYEGSLQQSLEWISNHAGRLHGLEVDLSLDAADNSVVLTESVRFTIFNAIQELLLNVVKHADIARASICVSTTSPGRITVTVRDEGRGFSPVIIKNADGHTGGFGLFALQERVSWLGGNIDIVSRPGNGCAVTFSLPVEDEKKILNWSDAAITSASPVVGESSTSTAYRVRGNGPIRVLLADDHAVLREGLVRILLEDPSFSVVGEASDGETAVELAALLAPDVVLMDVMMPGIGGAEATRRIRQANPKVQIIALSMYEERERGDEMRAAGAADYITKSRAADTVAEMIRSCCRG